jgi:hypothetical protein
VVAHLHAMLREHRRLTVAEPALEDTLH